MEKKEKFYLTRRPWAKAAAYVFMFLFFALAALGVFEALILDDHLWMFSSAEDYASETAREARAEDLTAAEIDFAWALARLIYNLSVWSLPMVILGGVGLIACAAFLMCGAGRRRGEEEAVITSLDKIPLDIYLVLCWTLGFGVMFAYVCGGLATTAGIFAYSEEAVIFAVSSVVCWYVAYLFAFAPFMSLAARVKAGGGVWWRGTAVCRLCRLCWRLLKWVWTLIKRVPGLCWRPVKRFFRWLASLFNKFGVIPGTTALACLFILLEGVFSLLVAAGGGAAVILWVAYNSAVFVALVLASYQLLALRNAAERMAAGNIDEKIDTDGMHWQFRMHAENLNSIREGMAAAVEQRIKSERLKTELITNVSHDIKTPLTSIVNYVDLLQRPHTPEQEAEYLEVLDRQSKRLKKLTEDLVEASKASTGNMSVNLVRTSTREIIEQSLAEYGKRMEQGRLAVVLNIPEPAPSVMADGRLLWRVLDNLFNNVCKYALAGTRVYVDVTVEGPETVISVKNISRDPLNVSADELMERFVRGDTARHTEGSGLGLNIAMSLTELMHGRFSISVDGDLFKAEIRLPGC